MLKRSVSFELIQAMLENPQATEIELSKKVKVSKKEWCTIYKDYEFEKLADYIRFELLSPRGKATWAKINEEQQQKFWAVIELLWKKLNE